MLVVIGLLLFVIVCELAAIYDRQNAYKSTAEKYNVESQKLEHINGRLYSSCRNIQRCFRSI